MTLKDKSLSVPNGSWSYHEFINVDKNYAAHKGEYHYVEGRIHREGFNHNRRILMSNDGVMMISDAVDLAKVDGVSINFNLDAAITPVLTETGAILDEFEITSINGIKPELQESILSTHYNEMTENTRLVFKSDHEGSGRYVTLLYPKGTQIERVPVTQGDDKVMSDDVACALKINDEYVFVVLHEEVYKGTKICKCEGVYFHSKVLVIDLKTKQVNVLRT